MCCQNQEAAYVINKCQQFDKYRSNLGCTPIIIRDAPHPFLRALAARAVCVSLPTLDNISFKTGQQQEMVSAFVSIPGYLVQRNSDTF